MILALVLLCVACGGGDDIPPPNTVSGPSLAGHPLIGAWRSVGPAGVGTEELRFSTNGTYALHAEGPFGTGCQQVTDTTYAIAVDGQNSGTITLLGPRYDHQVITCSDPSQSRTNEGPGSVSVSQRRPEPFSITGTSLVFLGTHQRVP